MIETINKLNRISRQMLQEMGREPTPEELGERMEMPEDKVRKVLKIAKEPISMETPSATMKIRIWVTSSKTSPYASPVDSATEEGLTKQPRCARRAYRPRSQGPANALWYRHEHRPHP